MNRPKYGRTGDGLAPPRLTFRRGRIALDGVGYPPLPTAGDRPPAGTPLAAVFVTELVAGPRLKVLFGAVGGQQWGIVWNPRVSAWGEWRTGDAA